MKRRDIFVVGFMLFAMFFGAGNLIFPVGLGYEAGNHYLIAIIGFMLTGIGLPLLTMIAGSFASNGYPDILKQINPIFSTVFLTIVYIMIGPFSGIPRTASTSYEMSVVPLIGDFGRWPLFIFSVIFFAIVLFLALSPDDLSNAIGKYLTPALLLTIAILIIRSFVIYHTNGSSVAGERFNQSPAMTIGFSEGYLTMDSIAALAFTLVLSSTIKQFGVTDRKQAFIGSLWSSLLASGLLGIIYFSLGWVGNHTNVMNIPSGQNAGTYLLVNTATEGFGYIGMIVLGLVVLLACITTATGLISSVASYLHGLLPQLSYRGLAIGITVVSCILANLGLNQILKISTPMLEIVYPITITIVFALLVLRWIPGSKLSMQLAIAVVTIISILSTLARHGMPGFQWLTALPLFEMQLEWLPFMIIALLIGRIIGSKENQLSFT